MKKKKIRDRNIFALALESPIFRQRVKESKKKYNRNKEKERIRKAVKDDNFTAFNLSLVFCSK